MRSHIIRPARSPFFFQITRIETANTLHFAQRVHFFVHISLTDLFYVMSSA